MCLLYMRVACCWLLHYAGNYTRKEPAGSLRKLTEQQTDLNASQMQIRLARCVVIGLQTAVITGQFYITALAARFGTIDCPRLQFKVAAFIYFNAPKWVLLN